MAILLLHPFLQMLLETVMAIFPIQEKQQEVLRPKNLKMHCPKKRVMLLLQETVYSPNSQMLVLPPLLLLMILLEV